MSSFRPNSAQISEPYPCPNCGKMEIRSTTGACDFKDGLHIESMHFFQCDACCERYYDDEAMGYIQSLRGKNQPVVMS
jgi:hypothetical protein